MLEVGEQFRDARVWMGPQEPVSLREQAKTLLQLAVAAYEK